MTKTKLQPYGTKRTMRISGIVMIASWLAVALVVDGSSTVTTSYMAGKLGALVIVGIGLIILSFFIHEKKKKEEKKQK